MSDSTPINIYDCPARIKGRLPIAYMVAVMQAAASGAPVQCPNEGDLFETILTEPTWSWDNTDYRIDPASKLSVPESRPFEMRDWVMGIQPGVLGVMYQIKTIFNTSSRGLYLLHMEGQVGVFPSDAFRLATSVEVIAHMTTFNAGALAFILADGHNPARLTVKQVGDGWRLLDRDEIIYRPHALIEIEAWSVRQNVHWSEGKDGNLGCEIGLSYRTRLSRAELAALSAPRPKVRRALTSDDLPAVFWLRTAHGDSLVTYIRESGISIASPTDPWHTWHDLMNEGYTYSSDRRTWLPFYIES